MRRTSVGLALAAVVLAAACSDMLGNSVKRVCGGVGYYALRVKVTDQYGRAQALGAVMTLHDGSYVERDSAADSLGIWGADERGGRTYDIQVSKRWYNDAWARGVKTPGGGCVTADNVQTATVRLQLSLATGAPAVRSLHLVPNRVLLDRSPYISAFAFTPVIDADPGVAQSVSWRLTGDTASVGFDSLSGALTYRCRPQSGYLTIRAISRADTTVLDSAQVAVQGHPAASDDPPCATP